MKKAIFIAVLIAQANAISWAEVYTPVQDGFGRMADDAVSIRDSIDCTISAVEQVFTYGGLFGSSSEYYNEKCGGTNYYESSYDSYPYNIYDNTNPYVVNETPTDYIERKDLVKTKEKLTDEINESVSSVSRQIQKIIDQNDAKQQIQKDKDSLKNETERLNKVGVLLRKEVEKIPEELRRKLDFDLNNTAGHNVLQEVRFLYKVEQIDKSSAIANEVRRAFDKVIQLLGVSDDDSLSDEDEVKLIIRQLDKTCNGSTVNVVQQVSLRTKTGEKPIDIKNMTINVNYSDTKINTTGDPRKNDTTEENGYKINKEKSREIAKDVVQNVNITNKTNIQAVMNPNVSSSITKSNLTNLSYKIASVKTKISLLDTFKNNTRTTSVVNKESLTINDTQTATNGSKMITTDQKRSFSSYSSTPTLLHLSVTQPPLSLFEASTSPPTSQSMIVTTSDTNVQISTTTPVSCFKPVTTTQSPSSNTQQYKRDVHPNQREATASRTPKPDVQTNKSIAKSSATPISNTKAPLQGPDSKLSSDYFYDQNSEQDDYAEGVFGPEDEKSQHEAIKSALDLIEQGKKSQAMLNEYFNNPNLASAPSAFDDPDYLDY